MKLRHFICKYILFSFILSETLFATDFSKFTAKNFFGLKKEVNMQAIYDEIPSTVPAIIYLLPECTTGVSSKMLLTLDEELKNQMILSSLFKPVLMNNWLSEKYKTEKARNIFYFINELKNERYVENVKGICKPWIFKCGNNYILYITLYPLANDGFPVSVMRFFSSSKELKKVVKYCLDDLYNLFQNIPKNKIKIAVRPFEISLRTLVEQKTGEFDFIKTSFSNQKGIELKESDDYFSSIFTYQAEVTGLFNATLLSNIHNYINISNKNIQKNADYSINGKVTLSNKINIITIQLVDSNNGKILKTATYFAKNLELEEIWKMNNYFLCEIANVLCSKNEYTILDGISAQGKGFYKNRMFCGWNKIENMPILAEKVIINLGSLYESDEILNLNKKYRQKNEDLYIYINENELKLFKGKEGEYVWNLLEK